MKKKLSKLLRYKTQQFQSESSNDLKNNRTSLFSIKIQKNHFKWFRNQTQSTQRSKITIEPLFQTSSKFKFKKKILQQQKQNILSNQILNITCSNFKKKQKQQNLNAKLINKIANQIKKSARLGVSIQIQKQLDSLITIGESIIQEIYFYSKIQSFLKTLNQRVKILGSKSLVFQTYTFSAIILFSYGNYSLSIFYFDKALKKLAQIQLIEKQERQNQIQIYKTISKIFLIKNNYKTAKEFGYKYLRKTWLCEHLQQELNAYDILGKIYKQCEQKDMSIYFHGRMCRGQAESKQIRKLSNYQLDKAQKQLDQFAVYQTIQVFIEHDKVFHQMLEDRYRMKKRNLQGQQSQVRNKFYLHTNRSPNRNLNTYRTLQRKLIEERISKQLHFIKPKQTKNLKKSVNDYLKILKDLKYLNYQVNLLKPQ